MNLSWVTAQKRSLSETLNDSLEKKSGSGKALIFHFLSLQFFNLGELLTLKKRTSHNRVALENSPWGAYEPEHVWESVAQGPRSSSSDLQKGKVHPARCYLEPYQ